MNEREMSREECVYGDMSREETEKDRVIFQSHMRHATMRSLHEKQTMDYNKKLMEDPEFAENERIKKVRREERALVNKEEINARRKARYQKMRDDKEEAYNTRLAEDPEFAESEKQKKMDVEKWRAEIGIRRKARFQKMRDDKEEAYKKKIAEDPEFAKSEAVYKKKCDEREVVYKKNREAREAL